MPTIKNKRFENPDLCHNFSVVYMRKYEDLCIEDLYILTKTIEDPGVKKVEKCCSKHPDDFGHLKTNISLFLNCRIIFH